MQYQKEQLVDFLIHCGFLHTPELDTEKYICYKLNLSAQFLVYVPLVSADINNEEINSMFFKLADFTNMPVEEILGAFEHAGQTLH